MTDNMNSPPERSGGPRLFWRYDTLPTLVGGLQYGQAR